jgi:hypothetical protein
MLMWNLNPGPYKTKGPPPENSKSLNGWATRLSPLLSGPARSIQRVFLICYILRLDDSKRALG